jgi:hypothetical protein
MPRLSHRPGASGPNRRKDPAMDDTLRLQSCIDACHACATACHHCATACLKEQDVAMMARCIALDMDCAAICELAAGAMARSSENMHLICGLCEEICRLCGDECARHQHQHCRACAEACRRCADECRSMSSDATPPARTAAGGPPAYARS